MKARASDLQKIGRLTKRADFLRLQSMVATGTGQKWVTPYVIIQLAPEIADLPGLTLRYGLTVTKKIFPRAVDRNRIRRRYRALFLSIIGDFSKASGHDFVLLPRLPSLNAPAEILEKDLRWALKRVLSPDFISNKAKKDEKQF